MHSERITARSIRQAPEKLYVPRNVVAGATGALAGYRATFIIIIIIVISNKYTTHNARINV